MRVWAWGANTNGQLGLNYKSEQESSPLEVPFGDNISLRPLKILGGASRTFLIAYSTSPEEWPYAHATFLQSITPNFTLLKTKSLPSSVDIGVGWDFAIFQEFESSQTYSSGNNAYGQLGRDLTEKEKTDPGNQKFGRDFAKVAPFVDDFQRYHPLNKIYGGMRHTLAITNEGFLLVWGDNSKFQLGITPNDPNDAEKIVPSPRLVPDLSEIVVAGCGKDFSLAVSARGEIFGCGQNKFGVLLHATQDFKEFQNWAEIYPRFPEDWGAIKDLKCGWSHVLVLFDCGRVRSWGRNNFGQLGRKTVNPGFDVEPGLVQFTEAITAIACGTEHNLALGESGKVYAWGWNEHDNCGIRKATPPPTDQELMGENGENGNGKTHEDCIWLPTEVEFPEGVGRIEVIGCGAGSSFAISSE